MQKRIPVKIPVSNILNAASRSLAVTAIAGYQKFISPHKGFSCAHRVLYGCESCSQYFKRVIAEDGILSAIANAKGRFQECREANEILKSRRAKCRARRAASRMTPHLNANNSKIGIMAIESGDIPNPDLSESPDLPEDPENPSDKKKLGGSQWSRKKSKINAANDGGNNNNCFDSIDCCDLVDCGDVCSAMPDLNCPDLNCDNADCLSGLDCNGCGDCGSLDCGGADCGSCG